MVDDLDVFRHNDSGPATAYRVVVGVQVLHFKPHVGVLFVTPVNGEYGLRNNLQAVVASCIVVPACVKSFAVVFHLDVRLIIIVLHDADGEPFLAFYLFQSVFE